jgi:hypothetical protein
VRRGNPVEFVRMRCTAKINVAYSYLYMSMILSSTKELTGPRTRSSSPIVQYIDYIDIHMFVLAVYLAGAKQAVRRRELLL